MDRPLALLDNEDSVAAARNHRAATGVAAVLPRDICNGMESAKGAAVPPDYYYWDGKIIRAKDGTYHLFESSWAGSLGFGNWGQSDAVHSVSTGGMLGPYTRQGFVDSRPALAMLWGIFGFAMLRRRARKTNL